MWCFFSLWQILFVDGVSVGFMGTMVIPGLLMHCWGKVHSRRNHVLRMVYIYWGKVLSRRSHGHVLRMVYMIEVQEVSDWVQGGVLCVMLLVMGDRLHEMLFMLNNGGWC